MKSNKMTIRQFQPDPEIENLIENVHAKLKEKAANNARHFALRNRPDAVGDCLDHFTGDITSGYEKLLADVKHLIQASVSWPEAKIDADHFKEKDNILDKEIREREHQNQNSEYELENFDPTLIFKRMSIAVVSALILSIGETAFNTKAFQVMGESLAMSLILSIGVTLGIFLYSHLWISLYKKMEHAWQRWAVIIGAFSIATLLFRGLASLRSDYLAAHDVNINPWYFVIINLFFFIVSSLVSFFIMPSWQELKENASKIRLYLAVRKRRKEIEGFKKQRAELRETIAERTKLRIRLIHFENGYTERITRMKQESIETFKQTNLAYRKDYKTPDCFNKNRSDENKSTSYDIPNIVKNILNP